jgi:DNA-binding response OmpR family regulator
MVDTKKRILITEDEKPLARALALKLTKENFDVDNAYDGEEALNKLTATTYDLVLLDLVMPKLNGFDVLKKLKEQNKPVKVVVLSNLSQEDDVKRAKEFGALDFIVKSDRSIAEIIERVKSLI